MLDIKRMKLASVIGISRASPFAAIGSRAANRAISSRAHCVSKTAKKRAFSTYEDIPNLFQTKDSNNGNFKSAQDKTMSFAMSGCGWLTPFYFGVVEKMREAGYITDESLMAGTSGGSLGALIAVSGELLEE